MQSLCITHRRTAVSALRPETTLAEMEYRAEAVECLGLKSCFEERVPNASLIYGRRSSSNFFTAGGRAVRWGGSSDLGLVTSLPSKSGLRRSSSKFAGMSTPATESCRAPSGRPDRAHQDGGGRAW